MSNPIQSGLMALLMEISVLALASKLVCNNGVDGKDKFYAFGFCLLNQSLGEFKFIFFFHQRLAPPCPPRALKKVYDMPPPMSQVIDFIQQLFDDQNFLSEILAPPMMAVKGFAACSNTFTATLSNSCRHDKSRRIFP